MTWERNPVLSKATYFLVSLVQTVQERLLNQKALQDSGMTTRRPKKEPFMQKNRARENSFAVVFGSNVTIYLTITFGVIVTIKKWGISKCSVSYFLWYLEHHLYRDSHYHHLCEIQRKDMSQQFTKSVWVWKMKNILGSTCRPYFWLIQNWPVFYMLQFWK